MLISGLSPAQGQGELEVRIGERRTARGASQVSARAGRKLSGRPERYQIFKVASGTDIMRNATVPVKDRVALFSYKASGERLGPLFDGTEKVVSIDSFHWYNRGVYNP